jgi:hypothetical protein
LYSIGHDTSLMTLLGKDWSRAMLPADDDAGKG